jgi:thiol-disulfide isomerase/thioredoxin
MLKNKLNIVFAVPKAILPAVILVSLVLVSNVQAFSDLDPAHPQFPAIEYVRNQNWMKGYADDSFRPDQTLNRAEFAKILVSTMGITEQDCDLSKWNFRDVPANAWFAQPVCHAKANSLINGYADGRFKPESQISFAEAAKIIVLAQKGQVSAQSNQKWFQPYLDYLKDHQAIPDSLRTPEQLLTRGQLAEILYLLNNQQGISFEGILLAGASDKSQFLEFNSKDYQKALDENKTIVLYFFSNWCPICHKSLPNRLAVFNKLQDSQVVGFKVDYADANTERAETLLAQELKVTSQSTTLIIKNGREVFRFIGDMERDQIISEILNN